MKKFVFTSTIHTSNLENLIKDTDEKINYQNSGVVHIKLQQLCSMYNSAYNKVDEPMDTESFI